MNRNAPKCILGAVVVALFLTVTWSTTSARLSTTTNSTAVEAGAASLEPASPRAGGAIVIDSAPNVSLEALAEPGVTASVAAPFAPPKANLDQTRNGTPVAPISPPNWVNGNAGASQAHYNEGHSIPYRIVLTDLDTSVGTHFVDIEWDIRQGSKNAIDYITHYQRLLPHLFNPAHSAETVDPTVGVAGVTAAGFTLKDIPRPNDSSPSTATTSFDALKNLPVDSGNPTGPKQGQMTIYNGTISTLQYLSEGSLAAASSSTRMRISFNATSPTVVIAWGGHIGASADWGAGNAASGVSGSPYHTRLILLDGASTGNQDRSLSAGAVFVPPDCLITCKDATGADIACPASVCPGSTNRYSGPSGSFTYLWTITSGSATISGSNTGQTVNVIANATCGSYTLSLKITRTADNGMSTCTKTVSVVDETAPTVTVCPPSAPIQCPATPAFGTPTFSDNCDTNLTVTFSNSSTAGCSAGTGTFSRTWTATDDCGNTASCTQTITVVDTLAPSISCPSNRELQCGDSTAPLNTGTATGSDTCSSVIISHVDVATTANCTGRAGIDRTWRATDACGNFNTCVQQIRFVDTTPPSLTCPAPVTVQCASNVPAVDISSVTASDNCGGTVTVSHVGDAISNQTCANRYTVTRTYRGTDACGNHADCTQIITVNDTTPPDITCPPNTSIECTGDTSPGATGSATASDNCGGDVTITHSDSFAPGCGNTGVITRTWTATDVCGNHASCPQTITVVDTTPPSINCPPNVTVTCFDDVPPDDFAGGSASDTCGTVTISPSDQLTDANACGNGCGGRILRTYTATDACGNTASCTQTITFGNPSNSANPQKELLSRLLSSGDLVVGVPGTRSLTIPGGVNARASATCLLSKLSAGGSAGPLPDFGDKRLDPSTCQTSASLDQEDGTWRTVLLSQAVSLALNLRLDTQRQLQRLEQRAKTGGLASNLRVDRPDADFDLGAFALTSTFLTQGSLPGADGVLGTSDDELDLSSARTQFVIPASVLAALGTNATATDLLRLTNAALAGIPTGDVKLSDIAAALDAVNRSYDFGKRRILLNSQPSQR
jgi:hypothetical protein